MPTPFRLDFDRFELGDACRDDGPDVVTPGTKMPVQRLKSVTRRDALIKYLEEATSAN